MPGQNGHTGMSKETAVRFERIAARMDDFIRRDQRQAPTPVPTPRRGNGALVRLPIEDLLKDNQHRRRAKSRH